MTTIIMGLALSSYGEMRHNKRLPEESRALVYVIVQQNESIDSALKRFNMKLQQSGVLRELKEHAHFEKPSEKKRRLRRRRISKQ